MKLVFLGCFGIKRNLPFTFEVYVVDEIHYCLEIHVLNQLCYFSLGLFIHILIDLLLGLFSLAEVGAETL
uniref:Uncharacterized protein n=1 Tax=Anguilla anguilla TaxID=7936 RepID=A0A0E9T2H4_ANGAN